MNPIIGYIEERISELKQFAENNPAIGGYANFSIEELQTLLNKIKETNK